MKENITDKEKKKIIEMASIMCGHKGTCQDCLMECTRFGFAFDCECLTFAEKVYKKGYRKQSETIKEFAQEAISRVFEGITKRFCDCCRDGLIRGYPDSELSWNFFRAFDECKDIAEKEINELAEQYGKVEK